MAARTGASVGVAVTITILGMLSLALFVLTMVFYGRATSAEREAKDANTAMLTFVTDSERNSERVRAIQERAGKERTTVVSYLVQQLRQTMDKAAGNADLTYAELQDRLASVQGADANALTEVISGRDRQIAALNDQLAQARADFEQANKAREDLSAQVAQLNDEFDAAGQTMRGEVNDLSGQFANYQGGVDGIVQKLNDQIDQLRASNEQREDTLKADLDETRRQNILLQDQVRRLRGEGHSDVVKPLDEASLVDGRVDRVDAAENEVILSIGRSQKVILGMTFAVYSSAGDIRPDAATGIYTPGKATVEVIRVEPNFCRARIISEARGNPIVRGDVVANAVYDPNKTYKMVVYGLFDRNDDGLATSVEREDVEALISAWGGKIVDDITGDVDFLVLGERPHLGPPPDAGAPLEVVLEYTRLQEVIQRYDDLLAKAQATSVPVLNENRLRTLIGDYPD